MFLTNMVDSILENDYNMDQEEFGCDDCSKNVFIPKMNMNKNVMEQNVM